MIVNNTSGYVSIPTVLPHHTKCRLLGEIVGSSSLHWKKGFFPSGSRHGHGSWAPCSIVRCIWAAGGLCFHQWSSPGGSTCRVLSCTQPPNVKIPQLCDLSCVSSSRALQIEKAQLQMLAMRKTHQPASKQTDGITHTRACSCQPHSFRSETKPNAIKLPLFIQEAACDEQKKPARQ